jgi:hypothetical protein
VRLHRRLLSIFADYFQFYLQDPDWAQGPPTHYTDEDVRVRLKVAPSLVVVQPARNMTVPVTVEIHDTEPPCDPGPWDHVAECSLDLDSGKLQVHSCTGGPLADFDVEPGWYRVRAFFGNLGSVSGNRLRGKDHYLVVLWPAPQAELRVLKQWPGWVDA